MGVATKQSIHADVFESWINKKRGENNLLADERTRERKIDLRKFHNSRGHNEAITDHGLSNIPSLHANEPWMSFQSQSETAFNGISSGLKSFDWYFMSLYDIRQQPIPSPLQLIHFRRDIYCAHKPTRSLIFEESFENLVCTIFILCLEENREIITFHSRNFFLASHECDVNLSREKR